MPSYAHDVARTIARALLRTVLPAQDLVVGELAVLWDRHDHRRHLVPDLMAALGAGELDPVYGVTRLQYRIWDESSPPDLVVEFASRSTVGRDNLGKKEDYAGLGVREYVQFDPLGEMLDPRLQVYRLAAGRYKRVRADANGAVPSQVVVGYAWVAVGDQVRLREQATGQLVPTPQEARVAAEEEARQERTARAAAEEEARQERAARQDAEERAAREEQARVAAEARVAGLEAQLRAALAGDAAQRPDDEPAGG
jgi:hypothetical protein